MTNPNHTDTSRSNLVETLLCVDRGGVLHSRRPKQTHPVCAKAADRIEALEAENERLRQQLSKIGPHMKVDPSAIYPQSGGASARAALGEKQ